jgi:hypothetical protein
LALDIWSVSGEGIHIVMVVEGGTFIPLLSLALVLALVALNGIVRIVLGGNCLVDNFLWCNFLLEYIGTVVSWKGSCSYGLFRI